MTPDLNDQHDDRTTGDHDDIEAFVLGTLSQERRHAMTNAMDQSPELRRRIAEASTIASLLADSAPPVEPSPALRGRLLRAVRADIVGYALGTLDRDEADAVAAEVRRSAGLRRDLLNANGVVQFLGESAMLQAPSPDLRSRVLAAVAADTYRPAPAPTRVAGPRRRALDAAEHQTADQPVIDARRRFAPAWMTWVAAACFLLALGMGAWNVSLQQQLRQQEAVLAADRAALQALPGADRFWTMRGEPTLAPEAVSTLALNLGQKQTVLIVRGFPPLATDQAYQVWVVQAGRQVPIGAFAPSSLSAESTLVVPSDLAGVTHAMITIEPAGGSPRPTGPTVMGGDL